MDPFDGEEYLERRVRRRNCSMRRLYNKELHDFKFVHSVQQDLEPT
jgi:hypothetical protein